MPPDEATFLSLLRGGVKVLERYNQPVWYLSTEDYTRWAREQYEKERRIIQSLGLAKKK